MDVSLSCPNEINPFLSLQQQPVAFREFIRQCTINEMKQSNIDMQKLNSTENEVYTNYIQQYASQINWQDQHETSSISNNSFFHYHPIQSELKFQQMNTGELKQWLSKHHQPLPAVDRLKQYYVDTAIRLFRSQKKSNTSVQLIPKQNSNENEIKMKMEQKLRENENLKTQNEQLSIKVQCLEMKLSKLQVNQTSFVKYAENELIQQLLDKQHQYNTENEQLKNKILNMVQTHKELDERYQMLLLQQKTEELKLNKLQTEHKELEIKYHKKMKESDFLLWDAQYICQWIINFDRSRYNKYFDTLLQNMVNEGIDGNCLLDLDKNDLHRLGISQFKDKADIYKKIHQLLQNKNENKNKKISFYKNEGKKHDTDYL